MLRSIFPRDRPAPTRSTLRALLGPPGLLLASLLTLPAGAAGQTSGCDGGRIFLKNYTPVPVDYAVGSDLETVEALAPGESTSYCAPPDSLRVRLLASGRTYAVGPGGHHFWWVEAEERFGLDFDSNYFIPGPIEEREYRLENRLDEPVPFRLDGRFRRLDDGETLTLSWMSRWQPQVTFGVDGPPRIYRVRGPCYAFTTVSRDERVGFAVC